MSEVILQKGSELLQIVFSNGAVGIVYAWQAIVVLCVSAAIGIALYLLMGFGLRRMALNTQTKFAWLGFVPFARYYLAGKIAGAGRVFGKKMKNAGFWLAILAGVLFALNAVYNYLSYYPILTMFFRGDAIVFTPSPDGLGWMYESDFVYARAAEVYMTVSSYVTFFLQLAFLFFFVLTFMQLFKKFSPRNYFAFSLLAFFGEVLGFSVASVIVFAQRRKKAVNYNDYLKEQYMRMQGMYAPPRENPPDNPFREFGGRGDNDPGDPFAEFSSGQDKKKKEEKENGGLDGNGGDDKNGGSPFDGF